VTPTAAYDEIADWYEQEFLGRHDPRAENGGADSIGVERVLRELLGPGDEVCLEVGCGTGVHAARVRALGWTPVGLDISAGMLRHAHGRLPVARAVMVHTDMPGYAAVVREAARVLRPGGAFVHVGVHPCFCGGFADRSDTNAVVIRPGYLDGSWTKESWTNQGVRDKVGATHRPLPELMYAFLDAGLTLERFAEGDGPTPVVLGVRARK
jgi:SAM-dependent methyltransferase